MTKNQRIQNIFSIIKGIGQTVCHNKISEEHKQLYWYFDEAMCRLYDDNKFDEFVEKFAREHGFKEETITQLGLLKDCLDNYIDSRGWNRKPEETLADPEWHKIQKLARTIADESNKDPGWTRSEP